MPKCAVPDCPRPTRFKITKMPYCVMHLARVYRHGYPELKKEKGEHALEKLPHTIVDDFILKNCQDMIDKQIVVELKKLGIQGAATWNVRYRRRKLGVKKYLYGEIQKHRAWVRAQAIKKHGNQCELCSFGLAIDTHHIIPRHQGGPHEIENLMVVCPNCHALITREHLKLNARDDIPKVRKKVLRSLKDFYPDL